MVAEDMGSNRRAFAVAMAVFLHADLVMSHSDALLCDCALGTVVKMKDAGKKRVGKGWEREREREE